MSTTSDAIELTKPQPIELANPHCVRCRVDGSVLARQGSMVAYRGDLEIKTKTQGVRRLLKRMVTGEGLALMSVDGHGDIWLADLAKRVVVVPGDGLTVNGANVLCFESSLDYDINMVKGSGMAGGGLMNSVFTGTGSVALTSHGEPLELTVTPDAPVFVDTDSVVGWTSGLQVGIHRSEGLSSLLRGGSGELFQLKLEGTGRVIVQPSEGPPAGEKSKGLADSIGEWIT